MRSLLLFLVLAALPLVGCRPIYELSARIELLRIRSHAKDGRPIVKAIEAFRKDAGKYPSSLSELAPKYLSAAPDTADWSKGKYSGWDYKTTKDDEAASYLLRYYVGKGFVQYDSPNWVANIEGHKTVLFKSE